VYTNACSTITILVVAITNLTKKHSNES